MKKKKYLTQKAIIYPLIIVFVLFFIKTVVNTTSREVDVIGMAGKPSELRLFVKKVGPDLAMDRLMEQSYNLNNNSVLNCHQPAHSIGRVSYDLYGLEAFNYGSSVCQSGYYHGIIQGFLDKEGVDNLSEKIYKICSQFKTVIGRDQCFHGAGHGILNYEDYDLPKALEVCRVLGSKNLLSVCYGGVFMENFVVGRDQSTTSVHSTKWVSKDPFFPCNAISKDYEVQRQCYLVQASWMLVLFNHDFDKVVSECLLSPEKMIPECFQSMGRHIALVNRKSVSDYNTISSLCDKVPKKSDYYQRCIIGALDVIVDFWNKDLKNQATDLCLILPKEGKDACYTRLARRINFVTTSKFKINLICSSFEEPYRKNCPIESINTY